jgi:hypothetical protein
MSDDGRKITTARLLENTKFSLERAAYVLQRSQNDIIEEALKEFFKKHKLDTRYQLNVNRTHIVLTEIAQDQVRVLDVQQRNGVPPTEIAKEYSQRYQHPVQVIEEK